MLDVMLEKEPGSLAEWETCIYQYTREGNGYVTNPNTSVSKMILSRVYVPGIF